MTATLDLIPDADNPPPDLLKTKFRWHRPSRRSVFRAVIGTGMVVGLSALDLLPGRNKAWAAPYPTWTHCNQYDSVDRSSDEAWRRCNPDKASVSGSYCSTSGSDRGWHKDVQTGTGCSRTYYFPDFRCTGDNGSVYNAWEWRTGQQGGSLPSVRCSDGRRRTDNICTGEFGTAYPTTCKVSLSK